MKKIKINIVSHNVSEGGLTRAYVLAQTILKLGHKVEICGLCYGNGLFASPPEDITVRSVIGRRIPALSKSIAGLLRHMDGDIIYAVKPRLTSYGAALLQKALRRKRVILDMDDWETCPYGDNETRYNPTIRRLLRDLIRSDGALRNPNHRLYTGWMERVTRRADALTVDTHFLRRRFGGVYLPNGKDTSMFDPARYDAGRSRKKYGLEGYNIIMFPGVPRPHKGLEDLLEAMERLGRVDMRLVIVGENPYDEYDIGLYNKWKRWIIRLPKTPFRDMPDLVAAAHVVAAPQRRWLYSEAQFPIKITDGMAMAKPVLATRVGDIPEIIEDTGYIVEPGRPDQLKAALEEIFDDYDAAAAKGQRARERCKRLYSVDAMASILAGVLEKLLV